MHFIFIINELSVLLLPHNHHGHQALQGHWGAGMDWLTGRVHVVCVCRLMVDKAALSLATRKALCTMATQIFGHFITILKLLDSNLIQLCLVEGKSSWHFNMPFDSISRQFFQRHLHRKCSWKLEMVFSSLFFLTIKIKIMSPSWRKMSRFAKSPSRDWESSKLNGPQLWRILYVLSIYLDLLYIRLTRFGG